jgi:Flp pilus assembly protein CpaB
MMMTRLRLPSLILIALLAGLAGVLATSRAADDKKRPQAAGKYPP